MDIQDFIDDMFFAKGEFFIRNKYSTAKGTRIVNNTLEGLQEKGLEIHYELQKDNKGLMYIRLDCHIFPYWTIKGKTNEKYLSAVNNYYSKEQASWILDSRQRLFDDYKGKKDNNIIYPQRRGIRYLWLAKRIIPNDCTEAQLQAEVDAFISQTYPTLIQKLKEMKIIDEIKR